MTQTPPGWYADPSGDYESRWWDGYAWGDTVSFAGVQFTDPLSEPVLPAHEQMLWQQDRHRLSTHRVWMPDTVVRSRDAEVPLWLVAQVQVVAPKRRLNLTLAGPGYGGPRLLIGSAIEDVVLVGAMIGKWANRNRRAAGVQPPSGGQPSYGTAQPGYGQGYGPGQPGYGW